MAPFLARMPERIPEFPPPRRLGGLVWVAFAALAAIACHGALATVSPGAVPLDALCDPWK